MTDSPAKPRGRRPGRADTRGTICRAALTLFSTIGYDKVSLRAIAREADVDPALIHHYFSSKSDLFAMFIERGFDLTPKYGYSAMVTMQSWMFLSSYETLRGRILSETSIECMAHMANMVMGIAFGTAATVLKKGGSPQTRGAYCYVEYEDIGEGNKPIEFPPRNERNLKAARRQEAA